MPTLVTVGTHGHSFEIEDPDLLRGYGRAGWGLTVSGSRRGGSEVPFTWVHAAIPLVASSSEKTSKTIFARLIEVRVAFTTNQTTTGIMGGTVTHLHVWHGQDRIAVFEDFSSQGPLLEKALDPVVTLSPLRALGLSIGVDFPQFIDELPSEIGLPWPAVTFNWAAADYEVESGPRIKEGGGVVAEPRQPGTRG
ncbi:MAG TPA: hypothetical protein VHK05_06020 [Candidatus Limnocylindrales bacterium]|jgi:hypothetical protein|nr:hypothetical protein [Candidatus Limnocylindrales bacterium]